MTPSKRLTAYLAATCLFLASSSSAYAQDGFTVVGSKIYDPSGREFIAKGVNINGIRWVWPGSMTTSEHVSRIVDGFKFNAVRVPVSFEASQWDDNTVEGLVETYTSRGLVVMFEAHDKTGSYFEGTELETLKDFYRDIAIKYKNNPYVWINVQNEPGNSTFNREKWLKVHQEVIKVVRDEAGANNVIVCDGAAWGQDLHEWSPGSINPDKSAILSSGRDLLRFGGKLYNNIVFSVHTYDQWSKGTVAQNRAKMEDYIEQAKARGLALIIGEYGVRNGSVDTWPGTQGVIAAAQNKEVGRFVWAWWGGDDNELTTSGNGGGQYLNHLTNPTNLSKLGQLVWDDLRRREDLETRGNATPTPQPTPTRAPNPTPPGRPTPQVTPTPRPTAQPTPPASSSIYEAEAAKLSGCRFEAKFSGYSGRGYVDWVQPSGESIEWSVNSSSERDVELSFKYANGGSYARPLLVEVNGKRIQTLSFSSSGGWTRWRETKVGRKIRLKAGTNKVKLISTGKSGANVDLLKVK